MNHNLLTRAAALAPVGDVVEFGVFQGGSLLMLADAFPDRRMFGFDTFSGIPPTTVPVADETSGWVGGFTDTSLERVQARVPRAVLTPALFGNLPPLAEMGIERIGLAHIDADIYEGYRDAFRLITPHLSVGSVIVMDDVKPPARVGFDDTWRPPWMAFCEWQVESRVPLLPVWAVGTSWLWVVADDEYVSRTDFDLMMRETVVGSLRNIAHRLLRRCGRGIESRRL